MPPDILRSIGARVVGTDRDVAIAARDAAACAMAGPGALAEISGEAWRTVEKVAETVGGADAYQRSFGVEPRTLLKSEIMPLARAACPWIRQSTPLWRMQMELVKSDATVGATCPIRRPAAHFVLHASRAAVPVRPHPPAFRDRDLSACPTSHVRNRVTVRIRDALAAPVIDRDATVRASIAQNAELDAQFKSAGFARGWCETDLAARIRIDAVDKWAQRVDAQISIHSALRTLAVRGTVIDYDMFETIVRAYAHVDVNPTTAISWIIFTFGRQESARRIKNESRGEIFARLQLRTIGRVVFMLDDTIMPNLSPAEIDDVRTRLLAHALAFSEMCAIADHDARAYVREARTLDDANARIDDVFAEVCT